jgi:phosphoribosylamine--glycine ligase
MKVAVIGGGGREHALVWKITQSSLVDKVYALPGNGGISEIAECIEVEGMYEIIKFIKDMDLVVVGPEAPLVEGIVNEIPKIPCFGPLKEAATIEGDKYFAKKLMKKVNIPTAEFEVFTTIESAWKFIQDKTYPLVIKVTGLAQGKGSFVVNSKEEGYKVLEEILIQKKFGKSGERVIVEEYLEGKEVSVIVFTDGKDFLPLLPAQDYKRLLDEDKGPNTGGMGSYSPAILTEKEVGKIINKIFEPCIWGLKEEGIVYRGVLYAGLMLTENTPYVLEFNCRFGDPETQPVIKLLKSDIVETMLATIEGKLKHQPSFKWEDGYAVCVVIASGGYPSHYEKGKEIFGLTEVKNATIFHAGTKKVKEKFFTSGGRVLGIVGVGDNLEEARKITYQEVEKIYFDGMQYRKDIGDVKNL